MSKPSKKGTNKTLDAQEVFLHGAKFELSSAVLLEAMRPYKPTNTVSLSNHKIAIAWDKQEIPPTSIPAMVLVGFATELYLKCFILLEGKEFPKSHDFVVLFNLITLQNQKEIREFYELNLQNNKEIVEYLKSQGKNYDFPYVLEESRFSFEKWRYSFEDQLDAEASWYLMRALTSRLMHIKPEWINLRPALYLPPTYQVQKIQEPRGLLVIPPWLDNRPPIRPLRPP